MTTKPTADSFPAAEPVSVPEPKRVVLSREDIFRASDIETEWVDVPEWFDGKKGGGVYVRGMTAGERGQFEISMTTDKNKRNPERVAQTRERILVLCCVDESGRRIFQTTDVRALSAKSGRAITRVMDVAQRLSGMTEEDVDQLTGNSDGQDDDSSSTWP